MSNLIGALTPEEVQEELDQFLLREEEERRWRMEDEEKERTRYEDTVEESH